MILVNKRNNVIIAEVSTAEITENEIYTDRGITDTNGSVKDTIYSNVDNEIEVYDVIVPSGIDVNQYCYSVENGFYSNPEYRPYVSPEVEIQNLKAQIQLMQTALDEMIFGGTI